MPRLLAAAAFLLFLAGPALADPYSDGVNALNAGNYAKALQLLRPLAEKGDARAQWKLGLMHHLGLGVKEDDNRAREWLTKSADQGNTDAQYQLGHMYTFGFGIPKAETDPDLKAVQWYFKAAVQGHSEAQYQLGLMFLAGKGLVQSHEEGIKWIQRAAAQGNPGAKGFLGDYKPAR